MEERKRSFGYVTANGPTYKLLKENAERMKKYPTEAERLLWEHLKGKQLGYRFRRQYIILDYIVDFVCLPLKLIIEVDGGYHGEGEQPELDKFRSDSLSRMGYEILRFTNEEVYKSIDTVLFKTKQKMSEIESSIKSNSTDTSKTEKPNTHKSNTVSPPLEGPGEVSGEAAGQVGKLLIFSAPSGSGKSTIVQWLMKEHPEFNLAFSISCTTRAPRGTERNGVEYIFLSPDEFREKVKNDEFLEYEEVYTDRFYGTLKSQVETQTAKGENVVFDVDVKGGCNIKKFYGDRALSIFIQAPSIDELRRRLEGRGTDSEEAIRNRLAKASYEMTFAPKFDHVVVNDDLGKAEEETYKLVKEFLKG